MSDELSLRIASLSDDQRALLVGRLRASSPDLVAEIKPTRRDRNEYPLSFGQERLWFLAQLDPGSPVYNVPFGLRLRGQLDAGALQAAVRGVVARHEALRTCFPAPRGRPVQLVLDQVPLPLPLLEVSGGEREAARLARELAAEPFDLDRGPLLRGRLLRLGEQEHLLLLCLHHIVFDGWSLGVLLGELSELYNAGRAGRAAQLPPLPVQYADYAAWQRGQLHPERLGQELAYWQAQLAGAPELLDLPADRPRPARRSFRGGRVSRTLPGLLSRQLTELAQQEQATLFAVLLAGLQAVLARLSGQHDFSIGTPVAGRDHLQTEPLIGFFANTLVLRSQLDGDPAFRTMLANARGTILGALSHQALPFEYLVSQLHPQRDLGHTALFQTVLNLHNSPLTPPAFDALNNSRYELQLEVAKFDLTIEATVLPEGLHLSAEYSTDLFEADTAGRLPGYLETLLAGAVADPGQRLSRLPLLADGQRRQLLAEWNRTGTGYPHDRCIHELFEEQARRRPDAPAIILCNGQTTSYAQLNQRADEIAQAMRTLGARPGRYVAILLGRSPELVAALLAVLKTGAAYVPLEPGSPTARTETIFRTCGIRCLVTETAHLSAVNDLKSVPLIDVLVLDAETPAPTEALPWRLWSAEELISTARGHFGPDPDPGDFAYVVFTSGSTGGPKGVLLRHRPVVNTIDWVNRTFGIGPDDRLLFVTSPTFDLSVYDIFGILAAGGSIRVTSEDELEEPQQLARILRDEPITFWDSAPAKLQQLMPYLHVKPDTHAALRIVFLSGDWIPLDLPDDLRAAFPAVDVIALGGATEAAIWSNYHEVAERDPSWVSIPYGRPIQNARYYVLDQRMEPVPIGVPGALYIGGDCLASGYVGQPALTAEHFVPDPFSRAPGARLYRTGDRSRYRTGGLLEFLGRLDNQLKIRGYRVEPAEIETVLRKHPGVADALVCAEPAPDGSPRLIAYLTAADQANPPPSYDLRAHLCQHLPRYLHPARCYTVRELPVTHNGKLDRTNLPNQAVAERTHTPLRTPTEIELAELWAAELGQTPIGAEDNFFELGGHSLLAVRVVSKAAAVFGMEIPLRTLFESQTLAELAARIDGLRASGHAAELAPIPVLPRHRHRIESRLLTEQE